MPQSELSGLKNVFSINTFTFGKQTLGPIITNLLENTGIYLDNPAKARLMAMHPSLKERVAAGEKIDQILTGQPLELSLFITADNRLYILGDRQNIQQVLMLAAGISQIKIPEMVEIPAGKFLMGSSENSNINLTAGPIREVIISAFRISKYPITNGEYAVYLEETNSERPYPEVADLSIALNPVVEVSWFDGERYCNWLSGVTGRRFRLPTEAEWEYAARGTDGRIYPWGNEWDSSKAAATREAPKPVNSHPEGASPFGVMDMIGNVSEWVADWAGYSYDPKDLVNPKGPEKPDPSPYKIIRGREGKATDRDAYDRHHCGSPYRGFRIAEDIG